MLACQTVQVAVFTKLTCPVLPTLVATMGAAPSSPPRPATAPSRTPTSPGGLPCIIGQLELQEYVERAGLGWLAGVVLPGLEWARQDLTASLC